MVTNLRWVSADWLLANLDQEMTVIDCQPNVHDFIRGHIQGAVYLGEENVRLSSEGRPHVWADQDLASAILSSLGLREDRPVLVYTGTNPQVPTGDGAPQCMIAYSLARYGHEDILVLDGGLEEWKERGGRVEPRLGGFERSSFRASLDRSLFIGYQEFLELKDQGGVSHIDSRPPKQYQGRSPWSKEGHIPGAVNIPWSECFSTENLCLLRPREELERTFRTAGVREARTVICHCGSGRKAAAMVIVLRYMLGHPDVRLFEGSFTEWCAHHENETVVGPDPW
jgi:thiosulfate/3-mercaptopyruvate sulfurtransferase